MDQIQGVNVLCARPISPHFDFDHRLALYLAIAFVLITPLHRHLTTAAISFIALYVGATSLRSWAFVLRANYLARPTLDVYPVNTILQVCVFAFAVLIWIRVDLGKYFSKWLIFLLAQVWVYFSFLASSWVRFFGFENKIEGSDALVKGVQCQNVTPNMDMTGLFIAGPKVACQNPCAAGKGHRRQQPVLWGYINAKTMTYHTKATIDDADMSIPLLFGAFAILICMTLIINTEANLRNTRAAVYNRILGKRQNWIRKQAARAVAATWFVWSVFCLGALALNFPFIIWEAEQRLAQYPATRGCAIMKWAPWVVGTAIGVLGTELYRRMVAKPKEEVAPPAATFQDTKVMFVENVKDFGQWWSNPDEKSAALCQVVSDEEQGLLNDNSAELDEKTEH